MAVVILHVHKNMKLVTTLQLLKCNVRMVLKNGNVWSSCSKGSVS